MNGQNTTKSYREGTMKYGQELLDLINYVASLKNENYFFEIYIECPAKENIAFRFVSRTVFDQKYPNSANVHEMLFCKAEELNADTVIAWLHQQKNNLDQKIAEIRIKEQLKKQYKFPKRKPAI